MGKTIEELSELACVCARIGIQGIDEVDPASGMTNRERLWRETADVLAQLELNMRELQAPGPDIQARKEIKIAQMEEWEGLVAGSEVERVFVIRDGCGTIQTTRPGSSASDALIKFAKTAGHNLGNLIDTGWTAREF